jgi:hypothetical protein
VAIPLGVGQAAARREYFDRAGFVAAPTLLVGGLGAIDRCCGIAQRGDGVMQGGLVGFDLSDQMNAGGGGLLEDGVDGPNGICARVRVVRTDRRGIRPP